MPCLENTLRCYHGPIIRDTQLRPSAAYYPVDASSGRVTLHVAAPSGKPKTFVIEKTDESLNSVLVILRGYAFALTRQSECLTLSERNGHWIREDKET